MNLHLHYQIQDKRGKKAAAAKSRRDGPVYSLQQTHGGSGLKAALHPNARLD